MNAWAFDPRVWRADCEHMATNATAGCGFSYDLFVYYFSSAVERAIQDVPASDRPTALCIASELGYEDRDMQDAMAECRSRLYRGDSAVRCQETS